MAGKEKTPKEMRTEITKARKQAALMLYLEMGPERTLVALRASLAIKLGPVSERTIAVWSRDGKWPEVALKYDQEHAALFLHDAMAIENLSNVDCSALIEEIKKKHLIMLHRFVPLITNTTEARRIAQIVVDLTKLQVFVSDPGNQHMPVAGSSSTATANATSSAQQHLALLEDRLRSRGKNDAIDVTDDSNTAASASEIARTQYPQEDAAGREADESAKPEQTIAPKDLHVKKNVSFSQMLTKRLRDKEAAEKKL